MTKVYFPNLNGLRFLAAASVIFCHIFAWPFQGKEVSVPLKLFSLHLAQVGLITFFVLCSFLITYLLLLEKEKTGTINVTYFYIRRACRIWPLYYLIIGLSFFVLPHFDLIPIAGYHEQYASQLNLSIFFCILLLPNITLFFFYPNVFAGPSWTIGVEEPFYLLWPWLVKKSSNLLRMMLISVGICVAIKIGLAFASGYYANIKLLRGAYDMWNLSTVTSFPIGGIAAWAYFNRKETLLKFLYNIYVRLAAYAIALAVLFANITFPFYFEFYSVVVGVLVLNMATNDRSIVSLDNRVLNYLGRITYGYYMYHAIVIAIAYRYLTGVNTVVFYVAIYGVITVLSVCSYELIEKRFLNFKARYAVIPSTDLKEGVKS